METKQLVSLSAREFYRLLAKLAKKNDDAALNYAIHVYCEYNFRVFCELAFSHYITNPWNKFHLDVFEYYANKSTAARTVDAAPRGYAKSTLKTLFKPAHDICYGLQRYILFLSATNAQSLEKIKDLRDELLDNPVLRNVYDISFESARVGSEAFKVYSKDKAIFVRSMSAGTEARGLRYRQFRPSKIILDDVERSDEIFSEEQRLKKENWFFEVVSKLGNKNTDIEIVGTILHNRSLLKTLEQNSRYQSTTYKAVIKWSSREDLWKSWRAIYQDKDNARRFDDALAFFIKNEQQMLLGTDVLWPEAESYYDLMLELEEIGRNAFFKEKQNEPRSTETSLFDDIWWYRETTDVNGQKGFLIEKTGAFVPLRDMEAFGAIDPATGKVKSAKAKGDFTSIVNGYKDLKGRLFVHSDFTKRSKPSVYNTRIFEYNETYNYAKFGVEENLYRGLLTENITRERKALEKKRKAQGMADWGIKVRFYEIEQRFNKQERITTLEPKVNGGWILFNRDISREAQTQLEEFPQKNAHDDFPDALEMLWGIVTYRYEARPVSVSITGGI